jgi:hypothetical protein
MMLFHVIGVVVMDPGKDSDLSMSKGHAHEGLQTQDESKQPAKTRMPMRVAK